MILIQMILQLSSINPSIDIITVLCKLCQSYNKNEKLLNSFYETTACTPHTSTLPVSPFLCLPYTLLSPVFGVHFIMTWGILMSMDFSLLFLPSPCILSVSFRFFLCLVSLSC